MNVYGYARVSSSDQNLARQINELINFGIPEKKIFCEKKSGKDFDRNEYTRLMRKLRSGDLLVVKSIDRLGRDYEAIISEWSNITHKIGANIVVLDMPLLDTREKAGTLVGKFIADIILQVLSFVAENERANIRARQAEGIAIAKQSGTRFGRPKKAFTPEFIKIAEDYIHKRISLPEALDLLNMKQSTFFYHFGSYNCYIKNDEIC